MNARPKLLALSTTILALALLAGLAPAQENPRTATLEQGTDILAGITLDASTPIVDLLADPDAHEGMTLQIEGTVVAMCQMMGCWASLDDGAGNRVNVKVQDGVIDLREMAATEHYMIAEGVFQKTGEHGAQIWIMDHGARVWSPGETE